MRVLLTGGSGFVGQWLTRALLQRGDDVTVTGLEEPNAALGILGPAEWKAVRWQQLDVCRQDDVRRVVEATRPDTVFHLAGISFQPAADRDPALAYDINALGAVRLLRELARLRARGTVDPRVLVVGSGQQYGRHDASEMPLKERAEQRPMTVYGATKLAQEVAALQIARETGLGVVCTRSFNHTGPGQSPDFFVAGLIPRVRALANAGSPRTLTLGNDTIRDYLHVADVVHAYLLLAERGEAGNVYNVASGRGLSARELAQRVLLRAGVDAEISTDPALVRSTDVPIVIGSPVRLMQATGWTVTKTPDDIIDDLLHAETH